MAIIDPKVLAASVSVWASWPDVPVESRPKRLPHAGGISSEEIELLASKGWAPLDVRLMPADSDAQRGSCLKAWLEGIRLGTIEADGKIQRFLDLEARALGLTSATRNPSEDKPKDEIDKGSLKSIFGDMLKDKPSLLQETKKTGRPPGSKSK